ncbi:MAG: hypothetical protein AAF542_19965 [Pseudomonadota bacterium]
MNDPSLPQPEPQKSRLQPTRLLIESAAIFFSVLLAFFVEQWREDINERREAEAILNLVRTELMQNLASLNAVASKREAMLADYQKAIMVLRDEGRFPAQMPNFQSPEITVLAYELATDVGAVTTVAPEELLVVARAYEALEEVRRNDTFLSERNAQVRFNDGEQYLSGFIYYINMAMGNEPAAIEYVRDAIEMLEAR